jgi:hypothetical protein
MRNAPANSLKKVFRPGVLIGTSRAAFHSLSAPARAFAAYLAGVGSGCVSSQSARAVTVGSRPAFFYPCDFVTSAMGLAMMAAA